MMIAKIQTIFCAGLLALSGIGNAALIAGDNALNYITPWADGDNGGFGFNPWEISSNNDGSSDFAGTFIGDSTAGAGDINTTGKSFGMYAHPGSAFMSADRFFLTPLGIGEVFTFQMALNLDNGFKGMKIYAGDPLDLADVFSLEVINGASVSSNNATLNAGSGAGYNYGGNDAVLDFMFTMNSATTFSYKISRSSSQGLQGTLFSGTVSGLTSSVSGFGFFVTGTASDAAQNHLYVNNFAVVPEPSPVMAGALGLLGIILRRRRNA